jgi:alkylated DNA repair dioxygenase AlkB
MERKNDMESLFPLDPGFPQGFSYLPEFVTPAQEQELLKEISRMDLHTFIFQGYEAKRRVASFGYDYSFDKRTLSKTSEIPRAFQWVIEKVAQKTGIEQQNFAELLITEYPIGSVINWHRDAFPFGVIAGISLGASCTFRLRPHEKTKQTRASIISVALQRRSLYIIEGEARTNWQHSTAPVKALRYSITLRTLKNGAKTD